MYCMNCGVVITEWAKYCPGCGAPVPPHQGLYPAPGQAGTAPQEQTTGNQEQFQLQNDAPKVPMQQDVKEKPPFSIHALISIVLAIIGMFFYFALFLGIVGFFLSWYALKDIKKGNHSGRIFAIVGLIASIVNTLQGLKELTENFH